MEAIFVVYLNLIDNTSFKEMYCPYVMMPFTNTATCSTFISLKSLLRCNHKTSTRDYTKDCEIVYTIILKNQMKLNSNENRRIQVIAILFYVNSYF